MPPRTRSAAAARKRQHGGDEKKASPGRSLPSTPTTATTASTATPPTGRVGSGTKRSSSERSGPVTRRGRRSKDLSSGSTPTPVSMRAGGRGSSTRASLQKGEKQLPRAPMHQEQLQQQQQLDENAMPSPIQTTNSPSYLQSSSDGASGTTGLGLTIASLRVKVKEMLASFTYISAAFWANKLVTLSQGALEDVYALAQCYLHLGEFERAAHALIRHGCHTSSLACRFVVARCYQASNQLEEALDAIGTDDAALRMIRDLEAEARFASFQPIANIDSRIWLLRGALFEALDNRTKAAACYTSSLISDPFCAEALIKLEEHHLLTPSEQSVLVSESLEDVNAVEQVKDTVQYCYNSLCCKYEEFTLEEDSPVAEKLKLNSDLLIDEATRCLNLGNFQKCLAITTQVLDTDKFHERALPVHVSCLVELEDANTLFYLAHQLVDANPEKALPWFAVASYYYTAKLYDKARQYYSKATHIDINLGAAWLGFAHSFAIQNEHDQAMTAYFYAARTMSGSHVPFLYLGMEYAQSNNFEMALKFYFKAHKLCQNDPAIFHEIGVLYHREGRYDRAIKAFQRARKLHEEQGAQPKRLEATLISYGKTLLESGDRYEEALDLYTEALDLVPDSETALAGVAFSLHCLGRYDEAIDYYHKALALNPLDAFSDEMLMRALKANPLFPDT